MHNYSINELFLLFICYKNIHFNNLQLGSRQQHIFSSIVEIFAKKKDKRLNNNNYNNNKLLCNF